MLNNRVWTLNCCESLAFVCVCIAKVCCIVRRTSRSSLLYIVVWKIRWRIASTQKRVVWSLLIITNDLLPDMVIVLWRINFKCIPCMKEHFCRQSCYPCLVAETRTKQWRKWLYSSYNCPLSTRLIEQASNAFKLHLKGRCYTLSVFCNA